MVRPGEPRLGREYRCGGDPAVALENGNQLLFGRAPGPEGTSDIYATTR